jgi:hypothetical protein
MQIVEIIVEDASGMTISDRGTFIAEDGRVLVSARLAHALQLVLDEGLQPMVAASINGHFMLLERADDGTFRVSNDFVAKSRPAGLWCRLVMMVKSPALAQRQQFGRFMHMLTVASLVGAVAFWHWTSNWSAANVLNEINLLLAAAISFYTGMVAVNGD